jgi:uncharacterized protein (TIGR00369 family)
VQHLGIRLKELGEDRAELVLPWSEPLATIGDVVHGGAISTLVDTAAMAAAWSDDEPPAALSGSTVSLTVDFVAPAQGVDLLASAEVVRRGGRLCFLDVTVTDPAGGVVAKGLATYRFG